MLAWCLVRVCLSIVLVGIAGMLFVCDGSVVLLESYIVDVFTAEKENIVGCTEGERPYIYNTARRQQAPTRTQHEAW